MFNIGWVCSLTIVISSLTPATMRRHNYLEVDPEILYFVNTVVFIGGIFVYYCICKSFAKAGVGIMNRLSLNNSRHRMNRCG